MKCWNLAVIDCVESAKTGEGLHLCYIRAQVWRPSITCMGRDWAESSQVCHSLHYERETRKVSQCGNTICRRWSLERKLADAEVTEEEQNNLLKDLERRETEYMRMQRHKMGVDDFELLTIIGRGAFGEVFFPSFSYFVQLFDEWSSNFSIVLSPSFTSPHVDYCLPLFLIHQGTVFLTSYHTHLNWISFIP